ARRTGTTYLLSHALAHALASAMRYTWRHIDFCSCVREGAIAMTGNHAESFGDLLRRHRQEAGLTQEELAERAPLSARAISDLERGSRRYPYRATMQLLAKALRLSPEQLADFEQTGHRQP